MTRVTRARQAMRDDTELAYEILHVAHQMLPVVWEMRSDYYGPADLDYETFSAKWSKFPLVAAAIVILR